MKPALLLVDLQEDYLRDPGLRPHRATVTRAAIALLSRCRRDSLPVVHIVTTVARDPDDRMPHWKRAGKWICEAGTPGHGPPSGLEPAEGETLVHKRGFSGFAGTGLADVLKELGVETVLLAGIHTHACVRATALDAYQLGFDVAIASDAIGSNDPLHAAIALGYLAERGVRVAGSAELLADPPASASPPIEHRNPANSGETLWSFEPAGEVQVGEAAVACRSAFGEWRAVPVEERIARVVRLVGLFRSESEAIAQAIVRDIGKPATQARGEVAYGLDLADCAVEACRRTDFARDARRVPHGVVAIVTPWNNAFAIPLGKIVPALLYGNAVLWKPAPAGTKVAERMMDVVAAAELPVGLVSMVPGGAKTGETAMRHSAVAAITLTGGPEAGDVASAIAARRMVPLQTELGGNNAAIVWKTGDLRSAAAMIVRGAFGFAGQRCTANRRVVVRDAELDAFLACAESETASLRVGDPQSADTFVGPMISVRARDRVAALIRDQARAGIRIVQPHAGNPAFQRLAKTGAYLPPTIVVASDPSAEIVQEETFGPVLVVQPVRDWEEALRLCNGVRQGLAAALFCDDDDLVEDFLARAETGILRVGQATDGAAPHLPFGGWKASGAGPPEHGHGDLEFYTRSQAVYRVVRSEERTTS